MMKIKYNITSYKKIDYIKSSLYASVLVLASIVFLAVGFNHLSVRDKQMRSDIEKVNQYREKLENMAKKTYEYNEEIKKKKARWRNKVRFANSLIAKKNFDVIKKLDTIEALLPTGVYIKEVSLKVDSKSNCRMTIVSDTFPGLFQVYKKFSPYNPAIVKEFDKEGIYTSTLNLNLKVNHEKE